jgi:hypothetical protein
MEFGGFNEPLPEVPIIRPQQVYDAAGLKDRNPGFRGIVAYTAVRSPRGSVRANRAASGSSRERYGFLGKTFWARVVLPD